MSLYEMIPAELKARRQWVGWRFEADPKRPDKPKKVPVDPMTGERGQSNNRGTWADFDMAVRAVERYRLDGIGLMFGDGIFGIDIDHCIDPGTGELSPEAAEIVGTVQSYTEFSPSGTGLHILCAGSLPEGRRRRGNVEMYQAGRFFTVTGRQFGQSWPLSDCTERVRTMHAKYVADPPKQAPAPHPAVDAPVALSVEEILEIAGKSRGSDKFAAFMAGDWEKLRIGDGSQSAADQAFCNLLAFWFGRDESRMDAVFRRSGMMRPKWDERRGGKTYGEKTLERACRDCGEVFEPREKKRTPARTARQEPGIPQDVGARSETDAAADPIEGPGASPPPSGEDGPPTGSTAAIDPMAFTWDDTGNAQRFRVWAAGNARYNAIDGQWMIWDGRRWETDEIGLVKRMADALLDAMHKDKLNHRELAADRKYNKYMAASRSSKGKEAMLKEARHLEGIPILPAELDRPGNVFNAANCMVSLRTGSVRKHDRAAMLSKLGGTAYEAGAKAPHWMNFLGDITCGDKELALYLQRMAGYCLTGSTREQCCFFLYGGGSNGKSTFVDTLALIMGDYAATCQPETVMMRDKNPSARADIARLRGCRMVSTFEPNEGSRLDEGIVKQLTGGDRIVARFLYGKEFEFSPEFKILMATNHKPVIKGTDNGIWRRVRLVPFLAEIGEDRKDKRLPDKLKRELPGILAWAVEGAIGWYREGLPKCALVEDASAEYRTEMDKIQQFCDDCLHQAQARQLQTSTAYQAYRGWCQDVGDRYPVTANRFYGEMKKRFPVRKTKACNVYDNLELTEQGERGVELERRRSGRS